MATTRATKRARGRSHNDLVSSNLAKVIFLF